MHFSWFLNKYIFLTSLLLELSSFNLKDGGVMIAEDSDDATHAILSSITRPLSFLFVIQFPATFLAAHSVP